jgi:hypothetical protein
VKGSNLIKESAIRENHIGRKSAICVGSVTLRREKSEERSVYERHHG